MKLAFIAPTKYVREFSSQGDFQLGLAHLLDRHSSNEYEKALLDTNQDIILDNSLFENHHPEDIDSLLAKALRIKAKSFFAPDYLYDAEKTLNSIENTIYIVKQQNALKDIKINAVVQASNEEDFFALYDKLQEMPEIDLIGLSILAIPRCFGSFNKKRRFKGDKYQHDDNEITSSRIECLEKLLKRGNNKKKCHLLGQGDNQSDLIFAKNNCPWIISNDSSCCFQSGLFNKRLTENLEVPGGKVKEKVNFELENITDKQKESIQYNINISKRILQLS